MAEWPMSRQHILVGVWGEGLIHFMVAVQQSLESVCLLQGHIPNGLTSRHLNLFPKGSTISL